MKCHVPPGQAAVEKPGAAAAAPAGKRPANEKRPERKLERVPKYPGDLSLGLALFRQDFSFYSWSPPAGEFIDFVNAWRPLDANPNGIQRVATSQSLVASFRAKVLFRKVCLDLGTSVCCSCECQS